VASVDVIRRSKRGWIITGIQPGCSGLKKTHCPEGFWPYIDTEGVRHENDFILADFYNKN
jgi:hypothetical protein